MNNNPKKEEIIDISILMKLWISDENCHKTLGEMLPIYRKHIKQKNKGENNDNN